MYQPIKKPVTLTFMPDEYDSIRSAARFQFEDVKRRYREARERTAPDANEISFYGERHTYWEGFLSRLDAPHDSAALADKTQNGGWNCDPDEDSDED